MPHDVFISHSSKDKLTADAVCNRLESAGIRCWIAPRDIIPGEGWSEAILRGIGACRVMVLVFSENANISHHVRREVAHACGNEVTVIPLRIRDVTPKAGLRYYLDELHWLDALTPPLAQHLETLTARVANILSHDQTSEHTVSTEKAVSRPASRAFRPSMRLLVLAATALIVLIAAIVGLSFRLLQKTGDKQVQATPITDAAGQITPIIDVADGIRITLGEQQTFLNDKELGLRDMAGKGVAVIENGPAHLQFLFQVSNYTYLVNGTDFKHLTSASKVLGPGEPGEFDNAGAGVDTIITFDGKLYGFYEGRDREGDLPANEQAGFRGVYCSVGLVESDDGGSTWTKKGQIIKSAKPKEWSDWSGQSVRGVGSPAGIVDPSNSYVYLYYIGFSGLRGGIAQICMARAALSKGPPWPGNWTKFYDGNFIEAGLGGKETPVIDSYGERGASMYPHVTYSKRLNKYVLTFNINRLAEVKEALPPTKSGIYVALSDDGIKWSSPVKLISTYSQRVLGLSISIEPTLILDNQDGLAGWLVYAYTPKYSNGTVPGIPLYLVGRRIEFKNPGARADPKTQDVK